MKILRFHDPELEQTIAINPTGEMLLMAASGLLLAALLGISGYRIAVQHLPFQLMTWTFASLVMVHAIALLGWRRALALFALTAVISFGFEYAGVKTGLIFGAYHYTAVLDPKLLGTVPLVIPMAYFMVIYPSYLMANYLTRGRATGKHSGLPAILVASLLTALIMSAWDLTMDPVMVREVKAWVWEQGGPYFDIPYRNFFGWVLTTFTVSVSYRLLENRIPMKPLARGRRGFIILPLLGYGTLCGADLLVGTPLDTRVIAPFTMGIPLLAALLRIYSVRHAGEAPTRVGPALESGEAGAELMAGQD